MINPVQRNIIVARRVATMLSVLAFLMLIILIALFGPNVNTPLILFIAVFFLSVRILITRGFHNSARLLLCVVPPVLTLLAAILAKIHTDTFTDILYYDSRFFLVLVSIVPCLVFDLQEGKKLYGSLGVCLVIILLFDPVHEYFGVGYYQHNFASTSYYYINYVTVITFFGISTGAIVLRTVIGKAEAETMRANKKLSDAMTELSAQQEELHASQEQLLKANAVIETQKLELQKEVKQINEDLESANRELVKHNNELRQFSFTISHNLRGPIARLLGLANLAEIYKRESDDGQIDAVIERIKTSATDLDSVIKDLNVVLDLRSSIQLTNTDVVLEDEFSQVLRSLNITNRESEQLFKISFSKAPVIRSFKPMINSILFNLVSNAIKYQSPERKLQVEVTSSLVDGFAVIEVADNGMGIDLELFQDDMFKLYKRFHTHQEGKGMGLYLVKTQAELLNGFVEVKSALNLGTTFKVFIKRN
jgi:signal transduction histidine kinase